MSASLPFIEPCRPRPVKNLPTGDAWLHEPKLDGFRLQAVKVGIAVALYSKHGKDLTDRYPTIAEAVAKLPAKSCALDGELVIVDEQGVNFYGLLSGRRRREADFIAFDILSLNGKDLRPLPLIERKVVLAKLIAKAKNPLIAAVPTSDDGQKLMIAVMEHSLEGIVSKRRNSPYASGSRAEWVKVKSPTWRQAHKDRWEMFQR